MSTPSLLDQTASGAPKYSSAQQPGYVPTYTQYGGVAYAPKDALTWKHAAAELMAQNILYNPAASGKPGFWDESKYGSWSAIVQSYGGVGAAAGADVPAFLMQSLMGALNDYTPAPGDYLTGQLGAMPALTGKEYVLDPAYDTFLLQQKNAAEATANDAEEMAFKKYQFEQEVALARAELAQQGSGSSGSRINLSVPSNAGSGSSGSNEMHYYSHSDPDEIALQRAKIASDWKIAQLQANTQIALSDKQLAFEQIKLDATMEIEREKLALQREEIAKQERLARAKTIADYSANPNDLVARGYYTAQQQAPVGEAVDIFTGQSAGQMSFWDAMEKSKGTVAPFQQAPSAPVTPGMGAATPASPPSMPAATAAPPAAPPPAVPAFRDGSKGWVHHREMVTSEAGPEVILNPTGAPLAVVPNHHLAGYFAAKERMAS